MTAHISDLFRLDDGVAVVTGAGRGIGEGIALAVAEAGCDVVVTARSQAALDQVAERVRATGRRCLALAGDITDAGFVEQLADRAHADFGPVTLWVNNAGGTDDRNPRRLADATDAQWDAQLDLNLRSVHRCSRAAVRVMADGGSIVNMSSTAAGKGSPGNGAYAASKAGVESITRTFAIELGDRRIRVNSIAPGPVPTDMFLDFVGATEADLPRLAAEWGVPLGRLGTVTDIAAAVVFLASPAAAWISGQTLVVNGGAR